MLYWPYADDHFSAGVKRLTRIDTGEPLHMRLTDDRLFEHPWIYSMQTGWRGLTDGGGGRRVVAEFWGAEAWKNFRETMNRVLPNQPITDLNESDNVMHVLYDIQD